MDNNRIANDLNQFKSDIDYLSTLQTQLDASHKKVFEEVISLTNMWEGMAQQAFLDKFTGDSEQITLLLDSLRTDLEALQDAWNKYDKCEKQVDDVIKSFHVELL